MYIFGYGSLINQASRQRTGQTGKAVAAVAIGFDRSWGKIDGSYQMSPLVVQPGNGRCNGVVVEIPQSELVEFDRRERGYRRIEIDPASLELAETIDGDKPVWIYIKENADNPCQDKPILQTYVDTVLAGCLAISTEFAESFVEQTAGWHHPLEDDRHLPRYGNLAGVMPGHHDHIDQLLSRVR